MPISIRIHPQPWSIGARRNRAARQLQRYQQRIAHQQLQQLRVQQHAWGMPARLGRWGAQPGWGAQPSWGMQPQWGSPVAWGARSAWRGAMPGAFAAPCPPVGGYAYAQQRSWQPSFGAQLVSALTGWL